MLRRKKQLSTKTCLLLPLKALWYLNGLRWGLQAGHTAYPINIKTEEMSRELVHKVGRSSRRCGSPNANQNWSPAWNPAIRSWTEKILHNCGVNLKSAGNEPDCIYIFKR
jgi:hypothetical protein